jgi:hypothetical protein
MSRFGCQFQHREFYVLSPYRLDRLSIVPRKLTGEDAAANLCLSSDLETARVYHGGILVGLSLARELSARCWLFTGFGTVIPHCVVIHTLEFFSIELKTWRTDLMEIRLRKLKDIRDIQNYSAAGPCRYEVGLRKAADGELICWLHD